MNGWWDNGGQRGVGFAIKFCSLFNPSFEQGNLFLGQGIRVQRHAFILIFGNQPVIDFTLVQVVGGEAWMISGTFGNGPRIGVDPVLALGFLGAVAGLAFSEKNGSDVLAETNGCCLNLLAKQAGKENGEK